MESTNWLTTSVNLGVVETMDTVVTTFQATETIKRIRKMEVSCSCIRVKYNDGKLLVHFNTGTIPKHLKNQYSVTKYVTIVYSDNSKEVLSISATIKDGTPI